MGPAIKKITTSGLIAFGTCGICHAQSTWNWPRTSSEVSRPTQSPEATAPPIAWHAMPKVSKSEAIASSNFGEVAGLFGPSDFSPASQAAHGTSPQVFPAPASSTPKSSVPAGEAVPWKVVSAKLPPAIGATISPAQDATVAKHVPWDTLSGPRPAPPPAVPLPQHAKPSPSGSLFVDMPLDQQGIPVGAPAAVLPLATNATVLTSELAGERDLKIASAETKRAEPWQTMGPIGPMDEVAYEARPIPGNSTADVPLNIGETVANNTLPSPAQVSQAERGNLATVKKSADAIAENASSRQFAAAAEVIPYNQIKSADVPAAPQDLALLPMTPSQQTTAESETAPVEIQLPSQQASYVLHDVSKLAAGADEPDGTVVPIDILPFQRLISAQTSQSSRNPAYSTESMVGPLMDASALFANLNLENDFRNQATLVASAVRLDADESGYGPEWMDHSYAWVSPAFYHNPLYFEQPNLERYGLGAKRCLQPAYSAAHFFGTIGLMPYKALTQHPGEKVYTLGHNRPGDCVPYQKRTLLGQSYPFEALRYFDSHSGY